jgi:hypothetical protein
VGAWRLPASGVVCGWSAARGAERLHKANRAILEDEVANHVVARALLWISFASARTMPNDSIEIVLI